jgi:hypothetical protein
MASSIPVVIASDQSAVPVSVSGAVDTELPAAVALGDTLSNPTAPAVGSYTLLWDGSTNWVRARGSTANGQLVDVSRVQGTVTVSATNLDIRDLSSAQDSVTAFQGGSWTVSVSGAVDTELPAAAALADGMANPTAPAVGGFLLGWNGATWDRVKVANSGRLQVDVVSGGGGASMPTNPTNTYVTQASVATGTTANLDTGDIGAKRLSAFEVWSSVPYKAALYTISNGTPSTDPLVIGGGAPFTAFQWRAPHPDYVKTTASAGVDGFRVAVTNLSDANSPAADFYATFHYED